MLLKCCTQYVSKFGKLSSSHRTGKDHFSFQSQRREMSKNVQTTTQLSSFHKLARLRSKSFKLVFSRTWTGLPHIQVGFRKGKESRDQIANICWIIEKAREFQKNIYFSFTDYTKAFDCVDHNKLWKIFKEIGIPDQLTCLLRNRMQVKKQQLEQDMEQQTGSKLGKKYIKAVYCHPAYLTYMQSTSYEMLGWMNHKLESKLPAEISTTSNIHIPL